MLFTILEKVVIIKHKIFCLYNIGIADDGVTALTSQ